jgi:hypothetical protein
MAGAEHAHTLVVKPRERRCTVATLEKDRPGTRFASEAPLYFPAEEKKGQGWPLFAAIMFLVGGALNVIYGIAAISDSKFFVHDTQYILSTLNTWGWVTLGIGAVEALVAYLVWRGGSFGRWFGIGIAGVSCIVALMSIPAYPFWSLAVFAVDILIIYGLAAYGGQGRVTA